MCVFPEREIGIFTGLGEYSSQEYYLAGVLCAGEDPVEIQMRERRFIYSGWLQFFFLFHSFFRSDVLHHLGLSAKGERSFLPEALVLDTLRKSAAKI